MPAPQLEHWSNSVTLPHKCLGRAYGPGGGLWRSRNDNSLLMRTILSVLDRHAAAIWVKWPMWALACRAEPSLTVPLKFHTITTLSGLLHNYILGRMVIP